MITMIDAELIRKLFYLKGKRKKWIARQLGHSPKTIRKVLREGFRPSYQRIKLYEAPILAPVKDIIDQWLKEDTNHPHKQRHTARRIYQRLVGEYGFRGSEETIRRYVRLVKKKVPEVFIPLSYEPGLDAVADWGEAQVILSGNPALVQLFCMRLCFSSKPFVMTFPHQRQEAFFEGHGGAFEFYGGVPHRITYDNLKTAVHKVLMGRSRVEQEAFIALRSHYLFDSNFCNPGKAHEKGAVENLVGYCRRNFFVPVPEVTSFDELNTFLRAKCEAEDKKVIKGQNQSIGERYLIEKERMIALPKTSFECCRVVSPRADSYSRVLFETNHYSVPINYAYKSLTVKAFVHQIQIIARDKIIATHKRDYDKHQEHLNPLHYLPALEKKWRAFDQARPLKGWQLSPIFESYHQILKAQLSRGTREYIKILRLLENYSERIVSQAIEEAIHYKIYSYDGVVQLLRRKIEVPKPPPMDLTSKSHLTDFETIPVPCLDQYLELLGGD